MSKKIKYDKVANPEWAEAMRLKGRSSATGKHDSRPNRLRTRSNAKKSAIRDSY